MLSLHNPTLTREKSSERSGGPSRLGHPNQVTLARTAYMMAEHNILSLSHVVVFSRAIKLYRFLKLRHAM